ncbi:MAG: GNAT family N-acetyltransferase [Oscillospiraceae bacterium]|nr:GNAT family N-acetyltransferase [Oscillospiraceae bacterium]
MIDIKDVRSPDDKSKICNDILRALPSWFGNEAAIVDYTAQVKAMPFFAAYDGETPVGFAALKVHNPHTSEICVMGILKEYHRQGLGKRLVGRCEEYCRENKAEFLTVKTLDASRESESYRKTRLFYQSAGFKPLEVFPLLWDENNPCLFMAKTIRLEASQ